MYDDDLSPSFECERKETRPGVDKVKPKESFRYQY